MKIKTKFIYPDQGSPVVSTINVSIEDFIFPTETWTDFIVVILTWWNEELINQLEGKVIGEYLFMDGPFYFECAFLKTDEIGMTFKQRRVDASEILFSTNVKKEDFINEVKKNTGSILRACHENNLTSDEVKGLDGVYGKLLNILTTY